MKTVTIKVGEPWRCLWCGTEHELGPWASAHWKEPLTHTCGCGAVHNLRSGRLVLRRNGDKVKKAAPR